MTMTNQPLEKFTDGAVNAAIFKSRNGDWQEVNLGRIYKPKGGSEFKRSSTYSLRQAKRAYNVLGQAIAFMEGRESDQQNDDVLDSLVENEIDAIAAE